MTERIHSKLSAGFAANETYKKKVKTDVDRLR